MKRSQAYPSQYLSQEDVRRAPVRGTIADVRIETIGRSDDADEKPVIHFAEEGLKNFPLNQTNWDLIEKAYGDDSDGWNGKVIELYYDPGVKFGLQKVGGVRVRIPAAVTAVAAEPYPFEQVLADAAKVGMTKDQVVAALKERSLKGYNAVKDAEIARSIVSAEAEDIDNTIPF